MRKKRLPIILLPLLVIFHMLSTNVIGDEYHYNSVIIGDRAAGLGGAYRALSDDASGAYYNPAGIALAFEKTLQASINAYKVTKTTYKDVFGKNLAGETSDYVRTSKLSYGNFTGFVRSFWKGRLGISVAVPDTELERQDTEVNSFLGKKNILIDRFKLNRSLNDNTHLVGLSYGQEIFSRLSIGGTLYYYTRGREETMSQIIFVKSLTQTEKGDKVNIDRIVPGGLVDEFEVITSHVTLSENGIRPVLGLIWSPIDNLSLGLTYAKTNIFSSTTNTQVLTKMLGRDLPIFQKKVTEDDNEKLPNEFGLGLAYFHSPELLMSMDVVYYTKPDDNKIAVVNFAGGVEYYLVNQVLLRGGVYSNMANTPELKSNLSGQSEHVDLYGLTFSIAYMSRTTSISVGINYSQGTGEGQAVNNTNIQDVNMISYSPFLATSSHF